MPLPKPKTISRRSQGFSLPGMTAMAGIALSLSGCLLAAASFREPKKGTVTLEELPSTTGTMCLRDAPQVFTALDNKGCFSFAASEPSLQAAVLEQVSKRHKITFSALQLVKLQTLPFLATTAEKLPSILSVAAPATSATAAAQVSYPLTEAQLAECVQSAQLIAPSIIGQPVYFSLLIHAETASPKVMKLLALLQAQGVNRFTLLTRS